MDVLLDSSTGIDPRGWIALAVAVVCIAWMLFRPRFNRKDPLEKPAFTSLASQRSVERQMQNLLVELSDMTRQMSAQVDTRAKKLEELIRQADQKIATLRQLEGAEMRKETPSFDAPPNGSPVPQPPATSEPEAPDPRYAEIYSLADQGQGANEIATRLGRPSGEIELILGLRSWD